MPAGRAAFARSTVTENIVFSACPHDCPSTCALEIERLDERRIGRVRGAKDQSYTAGVICAKVARYAERVHHPDRLAYPLRRVGAKGSGRFERLSWDAALDLLAEKFMAAADRKPRPLSGHRNDAAAHSAHFRRASRRCDVRWRGALPPSNGSRSCPKRFFRSVRNVARFRARAAASGPSPRLGVAS